MAWDKIDQFVTRIVVQYQQLEFIIDYKRQLEQLQEKTGVQMMPDQQIPADKEELLLWKNQFQRLPEEIEYETGFETRETVLGCILWVV